MNFAAWIKFATPLIVISLLLFGLGIVAAWNVQQQQIRTSELVAREVRSILAEYDLYMQMREVRYLLLGYLFTRNAERLSRIEQISAQAAARIVEVRQLAMTEEERQAVSMLNQGLSHFREEYQRLSVDGFSEEEFPALEQLASVTLTRDVLGPAENAVRYNGAAVDRTNEVNRETTKRIRQGLLLISLTGGAGGLIVGLTLARRLQSSILQLRVSISGAAGKLEEVVGPLPELEASTLGELRQGLHEIEGHIAAVVERLRQRELEVLRNEQLAAVGQLAAGMAHELRNPLMPMKMLVQAAQQRGPEGSLSGRQLDVLAEEILRLETSMQTFLDFARPPRPEFGTIDLLAVVRQTLAVIEARASRQGVEIELAAPTNRYPIEGDASQLRQVFLNLLLNALDELPRGGKIRFSLTMSDEPAECRLEISDNGPGFSPEMLARLFEPFATSKETGTGLGLTICRRIVEAHHGRIEIENQPSGGARFVIHLPRRLPAAP